MLALEEIETTALNQCHGCGAEQLMLDKFCRRCGTRRINRYATSTDLAHARDCETKPLQSGEQHCQSFSGQLIRVVAQTMSTRTATRNHSRGVQRLICTLIAIPIWMLIVMLSPLDAIVAAKAAAAGCANSQ
jgi:hypothetical protein